MNRKQSITTIKVYSVISYVAAALTFVVGIFLLFIGPFMGAGAAQPIMENIMQANLAVNWSLVRGIIAGVGSVFGVLALALSVGMVYVGMGLRDHKKWARTTWIVWGALWVFSAPIGTLLGGFAIYAFGFDKTVKSILVK